MKIEQTRTKAQSASDAVIDGLIAGLFAGVVMILVIVLTALPAGLSPAEVLASFSAGQGATPAAGGLMHLAVSGIYGAFFGLLVYILPQRLFVRIPGWLAGLVYALGLLLLALGVLLPGLASALADLPALPLALGHVAYGLVLGWRTLPEA